MLRLRLLTPERDFRSPETLRRQRDQPFAVQVEVHQGEGCQQPFVVLLQASISHLGKSEYPFQDTKGPFHLGSYFGLGPVLAPGFFVHSVFVLGARQVISCPSGATSRITSVCP